MTTTIIYTGVTSGVFTVSSGDHLIVESGGEVYDCGIASGGTMTLSSGGVLSSADVSGSGVVSGPGILEGGIGDSGLVEGVVVGIAAGAPGGPSSGQLYVYSGGSASNVTVRTGDIVVYSGGSAFGDVISSGAAESITSSGTVSGTRVLKGGVEIFFAGEIDEGSTVSSGGDLQLNTTVTAGQTFVVSGTVAATTVISGATLLSGAVVGEYDDFVSSGGTLSADAGAILDDLTVASDGSVKGSGIYIGQTYIDGAASGGVVGQVGGSGGNLSVLSGSASGLTVANGEVYVYDGATVSTDIVSAGGVQAIFSSGTDTGGTILSGGQEILYSAGIAQSVTVNSGGALEYFTDIATGVTVVASGTVHATTTYSGVTLLSGASLGAYYDNVASGGVLSLGAGAVGEDITINSSGTLSGAGALIGGSYDSGLVSGVTVGVASSSGAFLDVLLFGAASAVTVLNGEIYVSGQANGDIVRGGGSQAVATNATTFGTTVSSGGVEVISSAATVTSETVSFGGVVSVIAGASVGNESVVSGGRLVLTSGATVSSALLFPGGILEIQSMTVSAGQTSAISGTYANGVISGVTLAGASLVVDQATVSSGGVLSLAAGVVMSDITISSGAVLLGPGEVTGATALIDGNLVSGVALGDAHGGGAQLEVLSGAFAISVSEAGGGDQIIVSSGGSAIATVEAAAQARLTISAGGYASATTIRAGADALVFGSAAGTHVSSGGIEVVESGGAAAGIVVLTGGLESILSGGTTSIATVSSGGTVSVAVGGKLREATEIAGGSIVVSGDAIWQGAATYTLKGALSGKGDIFEDGPGTLVLSGTDTAFGGEAIISGGVIELASASGLGTAKLEFGAGSTKKTLKIDAADRPASGGTFATTLIDFDSSSATYVDLTGLAFVTGATATLSGTTLTLKDGTYTAKFTLSGEGASKYSVFSDGAGGTEFRAAAGSTQMPLLAHAIATFGPGGGASHLASPVSGGAVQSPLTAASLDGRKGQWV